VDTNSNNYFSLFLIDIDRAWQPRRQQYTKCSFLLMCLVCYIVLKAFPDPTRHINPTIPTRPDWIFMYLCVCMILFTSLTKRGGRCD